MTFYFLALLGSVTRAFGDFREPIYSLVTGVLLALLWRYCPPVPGWNRAINWLLRWSTWALAAGIIAAVDPVFRIVLITIAVWVFDRFAAPEVRGQRKALVLTGVLYALWWTVFFQLPLGYRWLTEWSFPYTHFLTQTMSVRLSLGPSASAVDLLLLGVVGVVAITIVSKPRQWLYAVAAVVLLEAGRILYIWMAPELQSLVGRVAPVSLTPHLDMPAAYFLFVALVLALLQRTAVSEPSPVLSPGRGRRSRWLWAAGGGLVAAVIVAGAASYSDAPVRVLFLNKNTLDEMVPTHGRYGDRSGGMFGFLPRFLEAAGHKVYHRDLTGQILDSVDVIIIANLLNKLSPEERQRVWDFVAGGGGLLILGDHTGTDAIRDPTNDLLQPCGLEINFDTAVPLRRSWASARSFLFHPLARSGGVMDAELWLGASVTPGPKGDPVVIGRGAFSDPGDLNNKGRSYLGNLAYDPGEPLGDVVLVAAAHWGKGKAILHGDTSPYQNGTIVRSHALIDRSVRWLAKGGWAAFLDRWRGWLLFLIIGIWGTVLAISGRREPALLAAALLLPVASVSLWSAIPGAADRTWIDGSYRQALIDEGHHSLFDGMSWEPKSIGGLQYNLMRNGFSPRYVRSAHALSHEKAALYLLCSPTTPVSSEEIDKMERFMDRGGWVIVTSGWDTHEEVAELFRRFGLTHKNIPFGAADGVAFGSPVKLKDAYPISGEGAGIESLIVAFGTPVAKLVHHGRGGLIAIGDSRFLFNENLEGQNEFVVMDNINFFNELMKRTAGATTP
ncbi:MAG: hypothetical protein AB1792_10980 [Candidatus Zixiibacteriota bacterium]